MTTAYKPSFDTTIRTTTEVHRHATKHVDYIDWDNYPFDDPANTDCMPGSDERKRLRIEEQKELLRTCERFGEGNVFASNYGGWPRIWHQVLGVGMVSKWPYWKPRPAVLVTSTLGCEWFDWMSLTGAEIRHELTRATP